MNININFRFGRCESLEDMWIAGEFDTEQIRCSIIAKNEVERLTDALDIAFKMLG